MAHGSVRVTNSLNPLPIAFFCSRYTALSIIGIYALVQFADIIKVIKLAEQWSLPSPMGKEANSPNQ